MRTSPAILCLLLLCAAPLHAGQWFVAATGNDTAAAGTQDQPFLSIPRAITASAVGDTIIMRGGVYKIAATITISRSGTSAAPYLLTAAPGERPVLDCSSMPFNGSNRGIRLSASYWHIRGLDVKGAGDNGMNLSGSNNIIEFCSFYENQDTGLQLGGGASNNHIVNCDSYYNRDPGQGNADGFSPKLDVGMGNSFQGCRSWQNSDDGYDGYLRTTQDDITTTYTDCWAFMNGYLKSGARADSGNGNGFKTGGSDAKTLMHNAVLTRCVAFDNKAKGFDQNNNRGSITLLNCSAYRNGANNYAFADTLAYSKGKVLTVVNSLALGPYGSLRSNAVQQTNSWMGWAVTASDFMSIDTSGVRGPRKPDGSLPDVPFLHLAPGSPLIDAGTVITAPIPLPFLGAAPDLGAFESSTTQSVALPANALASPEGFRLIGTFPNPFNPSTTIACLLPEPGDVAVRIFDARGTLVREFSGSPRQAGYFAVVWDGTRGDGTSVASGVYFARISFKHMMRTARLVYLR